MSTSHQIEKLRGSENFEDWKFTVEAYFQMKGLWDAVQGTESKEEKKIQAKAELILMVDKSVYPHIRECKNANEIWCILATIFEDSGLVRRVSLIQKICSTKLNSCGTVEEYVNEILTTGHKLRAAGLQVDEEWVGSMLLAGLPEEYKPMIMGIQSSGIKITGDAIKLKLLQDVKIDSTDVALAGQKNVYKNKGPKCYNCNKFGHIAAKCPNKSSRPNYKKKGNAMLGCFSARELNKNDWFFDSGATAHMCSNLKFFNKDFQEKNAEVTIANNSTMQVRGVGQVEINTKVGKFKEENVTFREVLHIPDLYINLLSVSKIVESGYEIVFNKNGCKVLNNHKEVIVTGNLVNGMFRLNIANNISLVTDVKSQDCALWHKRVGHVNNEILKNMNSGAVVGVTCDATKYNCITCSKGKLSRSPFKDSGTRATEVLGLIHSDLCGPMEVSSINGSRYMLIFIDDFSRKVYAYFIKRKDEVSEKFYEFKKFVENQTGKTIKAFRSDNGTEYCNNKMKKIMIQSGIQHQTTVPYTPQQNGMSERMNRTIIEKTRCLLIESGLPKKFWAEAANTAIYLINRTPCKVLNNISPEEVWSGKKPNLKYLKVFGCKAVIHIPKEKRKKLDAKGKEAVFVGYCANLKTYRFYDPVRNEVTLSRDAKFMEDKFAYETSTDFAEFYIFPGCDSVGDMDDLNDQAIENSELTTEEISVLEESEEEYFSDETNDTPFAGFEDQLESCPTETSDIRITSPLRRSTRVSKPVKRYGYECNVVQIDEEPRTVKQALHSESKKYWQEAMNDELNALVENGTWEVVSLPKGKRPIDSKWCFKIKRDSKGDIERYKARLVIKGYSQRYGIDYEETFSPVVRYSSIRLLLSLAVQHNLDIDQMDVVTAFLQSELNEEIYMKIPEGFNSDPNMVCKLKKSLYGLKQASRVWNRKLNNTLKNIGLTQSKTEPCVYYKLNDGEITYVAIYVDDILIFTNSNESKLHIKKNLSNNFKMKDIGEAHYVLGMKVTRDRLKGKLWLDQELYINNILKKFNMTDCKPVATPLDVNQKISKDMCPKTKIEIDEMKTIPYQEAIGSIMYAAQVSRPDISYAVGALARYNNNPGKAHWQAVKRLMRYLKGTVNYKLKFEKDQKEYLEGFSDADWAGDLDDRKSTSGYVYKFQQGCISWNSKKQQTTALSTTEAEYMALAAAGQESLWLQSLFNELGRPSFIKIKCDNKSAINLSQNSTYHSRSKHIDIRHHFIRGLVEDNKIVIEYLNTEDMVADILTKSLTSLKHAHCCELMGLGVQSSGGVEG